MNDLWLAGLGVLASVVAGFTILVVSLRKRRRWVAVPGEIVGWNHSGASTPRVRYTTLDGEVITAQQRASFDFGIYRTGAVQVFYDPSDPHKISTGASHLVPGLLVMVGGTVFSVVAAFVLL